MAKKKNICIYCGKNGNTRDHVPPKSFFTSPLTSDLITVASCSKCNGNFGLIDEYVRDVLLSLDTTESISELKPLRDSMLRSFNRPESIGLMKKIYESIGFVNVQTPGGIILNKRPAFNLNRNEFNVFFDRLARALFDYETGLGYINCKIEWKTSIDAKTFLDLPPSLKVFFSNGFYKSIGNGQFRYIFNLYPGRINSLWIISFYNAVEFMIYLKES